MKQLKKIIISLTKDIRKNWSPAHWLLAASLLIGTFLRFYHLEQNLVFHGELGHNYLEIKNLILDRQLPLLGPPTSHPWLNFGPLFYWLMAPLLYFSGFNPVAPAFFMALLGSLVIILNFEVVNAIFGKRVALFSSILISFSPAWLALARNARFFSLTAILFYPFLFFLSRGLKDKKKHLKNLFWVGISLGLMLNFHLSALVLIPVPLLLLYFHKRLSFRSLKLFLLGILLPSLPFIIYNATTGFQSLGKLILWIPYRLAGFVGLYPKNSLSLELLWKNTLSLIDFFSAQLSPDSRLGILIFILLLTYLIFSTLREYKKKVKNWNFPSLVIILVITVIGLFVHGDPPSHYYVSIFPLPLIFFAIFLDRLLSHKTWKNLGLGLFLLILFVNLRFAFSPDWISLPGEEVSESGRVPYSLQLLAVKLIIHDAGENRFTLFRVGAFDRFEGDYAQNYRYLLWWLGNEPADTASYSYTIYEDTSRLPQYTKQDVVFWLGNLAILREIN